jgi:undecaprenyl-diphosphatase
VSYWQAILLGIIQGLTEFLPVSSSGHLAVTQHWLALDAASPDMLMFDVAAHLGTVLAVAVVFAGVFLKFFRRLLRECSSTFHGSRTAWRIVALAVVASVPTAVIGLVFKDQLEAIFDKPVWIGIALLVTGTLLWLTAKLPRPKKGWKRFGWGAAILVGVAQGLAIIPGISRSGATICTAIFGGLKRQWAAEFSFLIGIVAICGASLVKIKDAVELPADELQSMPWREILVGSGVSFVVGIFALKMLLEAVRRMRLGYFSYYCWLAGLAVVVMGATGKL